LTTPHNLDDLSGFFLTVLLWASCAKWGKRPYPNKKAVIKVAIKASSFRLRNPLSTRPWQHALELLHGYLLLAERLYSEGPIYAESWNFGPADASVKNVAWMVEQLHLPWGSDKS
jgi:hypothetical protein